jgi:ABC-type transport system involved in multi-copper enzyme maturation permease subunit
MFAALVFERDPLGYHDVGGLVLSWVQDAGGFAAAGIALWLVFGLPRMRPADRARVPGWQSVIFFWGSLVALVCYVPVVLLGFYNFFRSFSTTRGATPPPSLLNTPRLQQTYALLLTIGGICALTVVLLPFVRNLAVLRFRRVWAIAKLSFKEAVRRRVLWVFSVLLLLFMFATWFVPSKAEDQVRTYVQLVSFAMAVLLLFAGVVLSAFSIPADIRQQTIHTVLTKPVERFEVVLGRFLGYTGLMTLVLFGMTTASLLYVFREINPEAAAESLKARDPLYADLTFENTANEKRGESVGKEWEYRSWITFSQPRQTAVYSFPLPPRGLANRDKVILEGTFDVYRTTKGDESKGVLCKFVFQTWRFRQAEAALAKQKEKKSLLVEYRNRREEAKKEARPQIDVDNELAEKYGYYEIERVQVSDKHTMVFEVPAGLFRNALDKEDERRQLEQGKSDSFPAFQVRVTCEDPYHQYVGLAKYDLYVRLDNPDSKVSKLWFALNFYKGAVGLWFRLCIIIGVAVALSTYFTGVISLLVALLLFLGGNTRDFIQRVGLATNQGGGPMEALYRLATRQNLMAPLEDTTPVTVATRSDKVFQWFISRVLNLVPDIERFSLFEYTAEGFNITAEQLLIGALLTIGYLFPWAVLAFYLLKWREIASGS